MCMWLGLIHASIVYAELPIGIATPLADSRSFTPSNSRALPGPFGGNTSAGLSTAASTSPIMIHRTGSQRRELSERLPQLNICRKDLMAAYGVVEKKAGMAPMEPSPSHLQRESWRRSTLGLRASQAIHPRPARGR